MNYFNKTLQRFGVLSVLLLGMTLNFSVLNAQNTLEGHELEIELNVSEELLGANILNLIKTRSLESGSGPVLISGVVQNTTQETLTDLYFEITIKGERRGVLLYIRQKDGQPFSLAPMQSVYFTNSSLSQNRIPGIREPISFSTEVTPEGNRLLDDLGGRVNIPADIYQVGLKIVQNKAGENKVEKASTSTTIDNLSQAEEEDIFLRTPGDIVGSEQMITNSYPQFSWDGVPGKKYRLLVVKGTGTDSPEALLENAKSSAATNEGGSLLAFENVDIIVNGSNYRYPITGVQPLEAGNTYYWRVIGLNERAGGLEETASEIWGFILGDAETSSFIAIDSGEDYSRILITLIGEPQYRVLESRGFKLQELEIDGARLSGPALEAKLADIVEKIESGNIVLETDK